ncbi:uncharacterized protein LOC116198085 isoform X2 [Punica granatum]|uniref:Uncharacterized protein LOC116198085 isoform X2 n=1 Tax=Punica granatum TaxID=22663 RepID=A0A6P8CLH0_PUNGR|nr:uncharacterized protein LOC116198085 isoform X2 [Punica granatum]
MVTVSAATLGPEPENVTLVDMSKLSQSELQALSLRSSSSSLHRQLAFSDQLFLPKIDRSVFNESAGSRQQTYSRPDSAFSSSSSSSVAAAGHHHRNRIAGLFPVPKLPALPLDDDPERRENVAIIRTLKHYISQNPSPSFTHIDLIPPSLPAPVGVSSDGLASFEGERKRKRGRKPKVKMNLNVEQKIEIEPMGALEMKNKNGVVIDVDSLVGLEDPYGEELRKRTEGLQSEEELLAFMRDLGGEWGSRRKRRKIVDAGIFGDFLPIGWKLLLGLRRKEGRASVFCRRYVSPSGQQFISCKEIASYFRSYLGLPAASESLIQSANDNQQDCRVDIMHCAGQVVKDDSHSLHILSSPTAPTHSLQNALDKKANSIGAENLAEVQVNDLFECYKCNTTFSEKDSYLQHLVSFHQRTMRRYRIGSSVGDGVIMKDGKFECQFCHKVFEERRRYSGHVGIHVRNYVRRKEELSGQGSTLNKMESSSGNELPSRISKMDALIEIAQSSIMENSTAGNHHKLSGIYPNCRPNESIAGFASKANAHSDMKVDSSISDLRMENTDSEQTLDEELTDNEDECVITDVKGKLKEDSDDSSDVNMDMDCEKRVAESVDGQNDNTNVKCSGDDCQTEAFFDLPKTGAADGKDSESSLILLNGNLASIRPPEYLESDGKMLETTDGNTRHAELDTGVMQSPQQNPDSNIQQSGTPDRVSKGEDKICSIDQREDNLAPFEELRYDGIEPLEFQFVTMEEESHPMPEEPIDMTTTSAMEGQYDSSIPFGSEELTLDQMTTGHQRASSCVWCGVEFSHEATDSDVQSDSVGFMCPACKVKISGQLNAFGNGSPADSNCL